MTPNNDLEPFSESLNDVFTRLGLPDPVIISQIKEEWDELAGKPWKGRSRPLYVKGRTLVVEASSPSMIAFLRYGESSLIDALTKRLGPGQIDTVEVVPPGQN